MKIIILGIIQGLTEFLPISSSGHLVLFKTIFGIKTPGVIMEVALHFGTLLSIIVYFRKRIITYLSRERLPHIIIGTIPIVLVGVLLKEKVEMMFTNPLLVLSMLFITGCILFISARGNGKKNINLKIAFLIGIAQSIALIPGISRSGSTVAIALLLGVSREDAFEFSFILAIPALLGAFFLELREIPLNGLDCFSISIGTIMAFLSGLFALWAFYKTLKKHGLRYFTYYLWFVSLSGILLLRFFRFPSL